ncbi:Peptidase A1 [Corchorus olitorius]|uniref:Peptidase A1 n=1 Tax=Corchorus olitorius TaxID=93759 RepID=A0A1R3HDZ5_9ROSI|nr:Peptidase A1 [Corchorus olitorius]
MASTPFLSSVFFIITTTILTVVSTATIKISLSPLPNRPSSDRHQILNNLATSSIAKTHRHKHHLDTKINTSSSVLKASILYSDYFGGYTVSLGFGTPPQTLSFYIDMGSSLTWFPCCSDCERTRFPTFNPKLSSSTKYLRCQDPKCSWLFGPDVDSVCQGNCPKYSFEYDRIYNTNELLLLEENLVFPHKTFHDFLIGCSSKKPNFGFPTGVAGFGRRSESFPSQLGLTKFSYCLTSRQPLDNPNTSSTMWFETDSGETKNSGLSYTPLYKNQVASKPLLQEFYYVKLRKIFVGNTRIKIPYRFLVPATDDEFGGMIVDLSASYTFMERSVFKLVTEEFEKQMGNYSKAVDYITWFNPCFYISPVDYKRIKVPELIFQFEGGAKMKLPMANYFSFVEDDIACVMIYTDINGLLPVNSGPAIMLGNLQQQNYYIEFDLANNRLGFAKQICV